MLAKHSPHKVIHSKVAPEVMPIGEPEDVFVEVPRKERIAKMRAEFKESKEPYLAPVMERDEFRKHILSMSLFPNLFNKEYLLKHMK